MADQVFPLRMRPRLKDAPELDPDLDELFEFVWAQTESAASTAAQRRDHFSHRLALRALRELSELRHWLDGHTIGSVAAERHLRRVAASYAERPGFRSGWLLDDDLAADER